MIFIAVVALACAVATWFAGWWGVILVALVAGFLYSDDPNTPWRAAIGSIAGWTLLLCVDATVGSFTRLAAVLGGAMGMPSPALVLATLLFAALLGGSASVVSAEVGRLTGR